MVIRKPSAWFPTTIKRFQPRGLVRCVEPQSSAQLSLSAWSVKARNYWRYSMGLEGHVLSCRRDADSIHGRYKDATFPLHWLEQFRPWSHDQKHLAQCRVVMLRTRMYKSVGENSSSNGFVYTAVARWMERLSKRMFCVRIVERRLVCWQIWRCKDICGAFGVLRMRTAGWDLVCEQERDLGVICVL